MPDWDEAAPLIDRIAPEHLELAVEDPDAIAARVRHAGAIFLGRYTPEAIGDYVAGPNHVLPTSRSARFSSGLGVLDFMKRTTLVGCDPRSLAALGPAAIGLAEAEGLDAHALSLALRLGGAMTPEARAVDRQCASPKSRSTSTPCWRAARPSKTSAPRRFPTC